METRKLVSVFIDLNDKNSRLMLLINIFLHSTKGEMEESRLFFSEQRSHMKKIVTSFVSVEKALTWTWPFGPNIFYKFRCNQVEQQPEDDITLAETDDDFRCLDLQPSPQSEHIHFPTSQVHSPPHLLPQPDIYCVIRVS